MKIIKCGGVSLDKLENRLKIYQEIKEYDGSVLLVVSAFASGPYSTNSLKGLLNDNYNYEMLQEMITIGEVISSIRITNELLNEFVDATLIYKEQIGIFVESSNKMDSISGYDGKYIQDALLKHKVVVVPGFIGINQDNKIVSLNQNGSDLTAVIIAKMLNLNDVYLYKDVLGLASLDPQENKNYKLYKSVSYSLMLQIIMHGSNLVQEEALRFAKDNNITIHIQHYLNHSYETKISTLGNEKVLVFQKNDHEIFIDGYSNKENIENILLLKEISYDYILPCNSYLKIVTNYNNQSEIISLLHDKYLKGEL